VDSQQPLTDHLSQQVLNNNILNNKLNTVKNKSSKEIKYTGNTYANYDEIVIDGKKKWKHKFKEYAPLVDHP
jgi:hypothetical protein